VSIISSTEDAVFITAISRVLAAELRALDVEGGRRIMAVEVLRALYDLPNDERARLVERLSR
jgi:hypothetical protein